MDKLRNILHSTAIIANIIALVVLILSAFSDRVSPLTSIYFSYLGMAFPFILFFNLIFLTGWLIFRKWKWAAANAIVFICCWGAISTYIPIHAKTKEIPSGCIKLLTYNVMRFEHQIVFNKKNKNHVVEYIAKSKADIVCIQEYGAFNNDNHLNNNDIKLALKDYAYSRVLKLSWPDGSQTYGLAIFSKFPILSLNEVPINSDYNGSFIAELDIKGKRTTLINNHLESNKLSIEDRVDYYELTKEFDSQKLDVVTSKMTKRLTPAFKARAGQANVLREYIKKNKNPYIIVCGDFNDTPISYSRHTIKGDLKDAFVETGTGLGISYNRYRFLFRIDYIFHSKNIKAYNCTVDRSIKNSDHYPVWTYLQFN